MASSVSTFLRLDATAWTAVTALATAALVVAAGVTAVIAVRQLRSVTATWREEARAYVVVEFDSTLVSASLVDVVIRNLGRTPAFDVTITWKPSPVEAEPIVGHEFAKARMFSEPVAMMPPGREYRLYFDSHLSRNGRTDLPSSYLVTVRFRDRWGKCHEDRYPLDIDARKGARFVGVKTVHDAAKALESLTTSIENSPMIKGPIEVVTETRRQTIERRRIESNEIFRRDGLDQIPNRPRRKRR